MSDHPKVRRADETDWTEPCSPHSGCPKPEHQATHRVVPLDALVVEGDAPTILLDEAITAENWVTARATQVRFAPDSMTLPAGRYVLVEEEK